MGMDSWTELSNPRDIGKVFDTPEYAAWKGLRDQDDSRYLGLCMPRVLGRLPYGAKSEPVEEFAFEEETDGHTGDNYGWINAAYAMAVNINRAFKEFGWCTRIRGVQSGGEVINLPTHTFPTDDGGVDLKCPTEIAISDRREHELAKSGLIPLIHRKNTDKAAFIGAQSLYKPKKYFGDKGVDATASDNLSARLPYMFAVSRFAHYLKCMVRDKIGSMKEKDELTVWLQTWINDYVDANPALSTEAMKARKPLAAARSKSSPMRRTRDTTTRASSSSALSTRGNGRRPQPRFTPARPNHANSVVSTHREELDYARRYLSETGSRQGRVAGREAQGPN